MTTYDIFKNLDVIAIDPSLNSSGIYLARNDKTITFIPIKPNKLAQHLDFWTKLFDGRKNCLVLIEGYAFSKQSKSVTKLGEVGGIIRAVAQKNKISLVEIPSTFWKKASGFGSTRKKVTQSEKAAYIRYGKTLTQKKFSTPDEVDAYCIYRACESSFNKNGVLIQSSATCVQNLRSALCYKLKNTTL